MEFQLSLTSDGQTIRYTLHNNSKHSGSVDNYSVHRKDFFSRNVRTCPVQKVRVTLSVYFQASRRRNIVVSAAPVVWGALLVLVLFRSEML